MNFVRLLLLVAAFVLFLIAGLGIAAGRVSLVALGLACWVMSDLLGSDLG